jgi:hypothetical protein
MRETNPTHFIDKSKKCPNLHNDALSIFYLKVHPIRKRQVGADFFEYKIFSPPTPKIK